MKLAKTIASHMLETVKSTVTDPLSAYSYQVFTFTNISILGNCLAYHAF